MRVPAGLGGERPLHSAGAAWGGRGQSPLLTLNLNSNPNLNLNSNFDPNLKPNPNLNLNPNLNPNAKHNPNPNLNPNPSLSPNTKHSPKPNSNSNPPRHSQFQLPAWTPLGCLCVPWSVTRWTTLRPLSGEQR